MDIKIIQLSGRAQAETLLRELGCEETGVRIMAHKAVFLTIRIEQIRSKAANLLKQTFLGKGGDVALGRGAADLSAEYTDALIMATQAQYRRAIPQLRLQPWGLKAVADCLEAALGGDGRLPRREYRWQGCGLTLDGTHSMVMGILNVTPDSFSDGGKYNDLENAARRAERMQAEGADIIDIGAESTRPYGAAKITAEEELARLLPVLEKILPHCSVPVSVDTYKSDVAEAALQRGAHIINDIWGLQGDPGMARVAARYGAPVVVMHNREEILRSGDIMQEILRFLQKSIQIGIEKGVESENIIIDPGIGFAKTFAHNMEIMARLEELQRLDCPILLGASRKRFIGEALEGLAPGERTEGTIATAALGKMKGVQIHRVHDVEAVKRTLNMLDAMMEEEWRK